MYRAQCAVVGCTAGPCIWEFSENALIKVRYVEGWKFPNGKQLRRSNCNLSMSVTSTINYESIFTIWETLSCALRAATLCSFAQNPPDKAGGGKFSHSEIYSKRRQLWIPRSNFDRRWKTLPFNNLYVNAAFLHKIIPLRTIVSRSLAAKQEEFTELSYSSIHLFSISISVVPFILIGF